MDASQLASILQRVLDRAKSQGASAADASVSSESGFSVNVRLGNVETVEFNRDRGLSVTVFFGHRQAYASTADVQAKAIEDTVDAACQIAKYTAEDNCSGLPEKDLLAWNYPDLDLYHPWSLQPEQAIEIATQCEDAARNLDKRITNSEGAQVTSHRGLVMRANSLGFNGSFQTSSHSVACTVIAQDDSGMQRDMWYSVSRSPEQLEDVESIGRRAAQRSLDRLNAKQVATKKMPVIFQAEVAAGIFAHMVSAIRGGNLYRKTSFLLDHLNKQIFPTWMNIVERPHIRKAIASAPFDGEGVLTQDRDVINDGVLQTYLLDSYSARRLHMQSTGHAGGVHNLIVSHGDKSLQQLLKDAGQAVLVTELMGQGVNGVTGDYSRGAAGFWVDHGEIQYPIEEITIAGNLKNMFAGIQAVANDVDYRRRIRTGSILIDAMTVAGK